MKLLVDTNILIDVLRGHAPALAWFERSASIPTAVSAVTVAELYVGADSREGERAVRELVASLEHIAMDVPIAERAGHWRRRYGVSFADAMIAATAHTAKAELVTRNVRHFPMLKKVNAPY